MGKQVKRLDQQTDADRGIEPESLVADNIYIWNVFSDIVGYRRNDVVGSYQDGNLLWLYPLIQQHGDGVGKLDESLRLIVFRGQQRDVDQPAVIAFLRHFLRDVGIGVPELFGAGRVMLGL